MQNCIIPEGALLWVLSQEARAPFTPHKRSGLLARFQEVHHPHTCHTAKIQRNRCHYVTFHYLEPSLGLQFIPGSSGRPGYFFSINHCCLMHIKELGRSLDWRVCLRCKQRSLLQYAFALFSFLCILHSSSALVTN